MTDELIMSQVLNIRNAHQEIINISFPFSRRFFTISVFSEALITSVTTQTAYAQNRKKCTKVLLGLPECFGFLLKPQTNVTFIDGMSVFYQFRIES